MAAEDEEVIGSVMSFDGSLSNFYKNKDISINSPQQCSQLSRNYIHIDDLLT